MDSLSRVNKFHFELQLNGQWYTYGIFAIANKS